MRAFYDWRFPDRFNSWDRLQGICNIWKEVMGLPHTGSELDHTPPQPEIIYLINNAGLMQKDSFMATWECPFLCYGHGNCRKGREEGKMRQEKCSDHFSWWFKIRRSRSRSTVSRCSRTRPVIRKESCFYILYNNCFTICAFNGKIVHK